MKSRLSYDASQSDLQAATLRLARWFHTKLVGFLCLDKKPWEAEHGDLDMVNQQHVAESSAMYNINNMPSYFDVAFSTWIVRFIVTPCPLQNNGNAIFNGHTSINFY